ncbi:Protein NLRC3 [Pelomyxa schiedti]|nr:Protein NLRC3 [Pelomyxa schiedti]
MTSVVVVQIEELAAQLKELSFVVHNLTSEPSLKPSTSHLICDIQEYIENSKARIEFFTNIASKIALEDVPPPPQCLCPVTDETGTMSELVVPVTNNEVSCEPNTTNNDPSQNSNGGELSVDANLDHLHSLEDIYCFMPPNWQPPTFREALAEVSPQNLDLLLHSCDKVASSVPPSVLDHCFSLSNDDKYAVALCFDLHDSDENPFLKINHGLQQLNVPILRSAWKLLFLMVKGLRKLPCIGRNGEVTLFRRLETVNLAEYPIGSTVTWNTFVSTFPDLEAAEQFSNAPGGTLFILRKSWGYRLHPFSSTLRNGEILLEPGTSFKVLSVLESTFITIELEFNSCSMLFRHLIEDGHLCFDKEIAEYSISSIRRVIQKMNLFSYSCSAFMQSCAVLKTIIEKCNPHQEEENLVMQEVVEAVLSILKNFGNSSLEACQHGCQFLEFLSHTQGNISRIVRFGGIEVVLSALKAFPENSRIFFSALNSLLEDKIQDLGNGTLEAIPLKVNLSKMDIGDSGAEQLASTLLQNPKVKEINLSDNCIGDVGAQALARTLETNSTVFLNLSGNKIGPLGTQAFASTFKITGKINVNLSRNNIGDAGALAIAQAMKITRSEHLYLSFCRIKDSGAEAIAEALALNPAIKNVDFIGNNCSDQWIMNRARQYQTSFFQTGGIKLSELQGTWINPVLHVLKANVPPLMRLDFSGSSLALPMWRSFCSAIKVNRTLRDLNLSDCSHLSQGYENDLSCVNDLAEVLKANHSLTTVNCSRNNLMDKHAQVLMTALIFIINEASRFRKQSFSGVEDIISSLAIDNSIVGGSLKPLGEVDAVPTVLKTLNLSRNKLTSASAFIIADAIRLNSAISIDISGNKIGSDGVVSLLEALRTNRHITALNLQSTGFSAPAILKPLIETLKVSSITTLRLAGNRLDDSPKFLIDIIKVDRLRELDISEDVGALALSKAHAKILATVIKGGSVLSKLRLSKENSDLATMLQGTHVTVEIFTPLNDSDVWRRSS